ncbi:Phospholipid hydroperoxide glutathione peroxidase 1, chloroplastic [Triticum urartu]|uniref:Glutathione peroxidase n=1 Tax=Triticum urartu TaxID=4572 RepID=M7ZAE6_TRIUA|nr:Phospholipid hydroperoxide glutathione peroxidase 1, chloroplastic [Triticum urartu]
MAIFGVKFFRSIQEFNDDDCASRALVLRGNICIPTRCRSITIYVSDIDGKNVSLSKFKGKALLIVNVASQCGLTTANYTELSHLYEKYKTQGFEILAFPCNQFGFQEPGSNTQIKQFACTRFKAEFPIFDKVDVNGPFTAPIYKFLKSSAGGFLGDIVKWNFEKFLVDKNGKVVERYPPTTSPFQIETFPNFGTHCWVGGLGKHEQQYWRLLSDGLLAMTWKERNAT